jgi:dihydroorotate dehydrogenase electron transfer subunit
LQLAAIQPKFWFPQNPVRSQRKTRVKFFHELFTGRNLTSLAQLWHSINKIPSVRCRETLQYVFTAMLYSCSSMQMFSEKCPSSSRGWTALRFYLPSIRQEKNVWQAFENRFKTVLKAKEKTNPICPFVRVSDSMDKFENSDDEIFIYEAEFSKFSFPKNLDVNHVFLDPPYNDDIDYMGFSEFWTCWLGMASDIESGWHPGTISIEENTKRLLNLLLRIRKNTPSSCLTTLAYGSKSTMAWGLLNDTILEAGYEILEKVPILWDNSQKRGKIPSTDLYLILGRATKRPKVKSHELSEKDSNELTFFIRVAAFLRPDISNPEGIIDLAVNLVKPYLRIPLKNVDTSLVRSWASDEEINRKAYNRFAFVLIKLILSQDHFRIFSVDARQFDHSHLNGYDEIEALPMPQGLAKGADFVAENDKGNRILFCFHNASNLDALKYLSKRVFDEDKDEFRTIYYLIIRTHNQIMQCRKDEQAENWPRGFFIEFNELLKKARERDKNRFDHLTTISPRANSDFRSQKKIEHFNAKVLENFPVSGNGDPKHFMLRFEAPQLKYVVPGQFVMIDTLPYKKRRKIDVRQSFHPSATPGSYFLATRKVNLNSESFLKRPFSIHRAYYRNFKLSYLKNIYLSRTLAAITHTVFPHEFEIFYKLIESGKGTNELKQMKQGDDFQILGPLGKRPNLAKWQTDGIKEVHLIGGGVGMAPLMFFGQALRYYSFRIKAFIGIDRIESLYKAPRGKAFEEDPNKAYVYIDNLKSIGISRDDIHISSFEKTISASSIAIGLPEQNFFFGFVSEQYKTFLEKLNETSGILVLTCGPKPMLKALEKIASEANIQMKVLLEKRMGCGIGVCMSCVCPTKKDNQEQYSRVCMEGPLFDSEDIDWEKL